MLVARTSNARIAQSGALPHLFNLIRKFKYSSNRLVAARDSLSPSTCISTAFAALETAGAPGNKGSNDQLKQWCSKLKENWYTTLGDVAAMSKEEVLRIGMPVRLWSSLKALVAQEDEARIPQPETAADYLQDRAHTELSGNIQAAGAVVQQQIAAAHSIVEQQQQQLLLPADIMQRRMPEGLHKQAAAAVAAGRVRIRQLTGKPYALKAEEMTGHLQQEFDQLQQFSCGVFVGQRVAPLRPVSWATYAKDLRQLFGFAHRVRGVPLDQLSLKTLLPSSDREGVSLLLDYQHWREIERGIAPRSRVQPIKALICLARYLYHGQSQPSAKPPYRDLPVVQELANLMRIAIKAADGAPLVSDESKKWLEWPEFLGLVQALRAECAGLTASGHPRSRHEVAASLQRYLIVAILSVVPDRQRTLRELELGRTLLQRDGAWVIKHGPDDYKTGKRYGDRPPLVIAPFIYPELEAFINTWRKELQPKTNMLFCRTKTGKAHDEKSMHHLFKHAALRLTGKATNPHLVRDMIVTHLRNLGTDASEMEALAFVMAHSVKEQRKTYDRRTKAQKVTPAVDLMLQLAKDL